MKYDAITLDTNIFDENSLSLEGGMLQQLQQFKGGLAHFVLSEIVVREIHRHLTEEAQKAAFALGSATARLACAASVIKSSTGRAKGDNPPSVSRRPNGILRWKLRRDY